MYGRTFIMTINRLYFFLVQEAHDCMHFGKYGSKLRSGFATSMIVTFCRGFKAMAFNPSGFHGLMASSKEKANPVQMYAGRVVQDTLRHK
jgi:hypothetical protein